MQKVGSLRSINPYDPFLGIWTTLARQAKGYDGQLHVEEALSRQQALQFYTINNARVLRAEQRIGSLEVGKDADVVEKPARSVFRETESFIVDVRAAA